MAKRPPSENPTETAREEFLVEDIIDSRVNPVTLQTEFLVKWKEFEAKDNTWEPLDMVYECPILLRDLQNKKRAQLIRNIKKKTPDVSEDTLKSLGNFSVIKKSILGKFKKDPLEFMPQGNEKVLTISREIPSGDGKFFLWEVRFTNDRKPCWIRKSVVAYYWPFDASMFMHLLVSRAHKIDTFLQKKRTKK